MLINLERLTKAMDDNHLDGLVSTTDANFYYLTGYSSDGLRQFVYDHQAYAVINREKPLAALVVESQGLSNQYLDGREELAGIITYNRFYRPGPFLDVELDPWEVKLKEIGLITPAKSPVDGLVSALKRQGLEGKRIGLDEVNLKAGVLDKLKSELPTTIFVPASKLLVWVRKVKTDEELKRLVRANRVIENAIRAAMAIVRDGVTEYEMFCEFNRSVGAQGGQPAFSLIHFGRNAVAGETLPRSTSLTPGVPIWFDCGARVDGYFSDIARIGFLGEPMPRAAEMYKALLFGEDEAIRLTKPGMTGEDVFNLTLKACKDAGLTHYERHHLGHGIGLELYEDVRIAPGVQEIVEEGTVVNIETPYYEFGLGALHVEDPYVVRADGNQLLTTMDRGLIIVQD